MRYNVPKSCATRVCCACVDLITCVAVRYLTLRTGGESHATVTRLPFLFSKRSHVGNLRQIRKQGKGRSSKRKENRRLSFLFAPAAGAAHSRRPQTANPPAEVQRKTSRPSGANPPAAVRVPRSADAERSCPLGANPPAAVRVPRSAGAEKEPPVRVEPACGSSRAPLSRCRKGAARRGRTRLRQFACPGHLVPRKEKHRRIASTVLKVCTFTQIAAAYRHPYAPAPAGPVPDDRVR